MATARNVRIEDYLNRRNENQEENTQKIYICPDEQQYTKWKLPVTKSSIGRKIEMILQVLVKEAGWVKW